MSRATAKVLSVVSTIVYIIVVIACASDQSKASLIIASILWTGLYTYLCWQLRCPNCGAWPRKGFLFHAYCPKCGEPLD